MSSSISVSHEDRPVSRVTRLEFTPLNPNILEKLSVCEVNDDTLYKASDENKKNLSDISMGPTKKDELCSTCGKEQFKCPGHFGHIDFIIPMYNTTFMKKVYNLLNVICYKCARVLIKPSSLRKCMNKPVNKRLAEVQRLVGVERHKLCPHCEDNVGIAKYTKQGGLHFHQIVPILDDEGKPIGKTETKFLGDRAHELFKKMPDHHIYAVGLNPDNARPEWLLFTKFPVLPPCIRPSISFGCNMKSEDDLVYKLAEIIKKHNELKTKDRTGDHFETTQNWVQLAVTTIIDASQKSLPQSVHGQNGKILRSIKDRMKGKEGHFRGNILGKRVNFSGRTVIGPDPNIEIGEVGVPKEILKNLTFPETVTAYNIKHLQKLVDNGPRRYPGANIIDTKIGENPEIDLRYVKRKKRMPLKIGYVVHRHLCDKDYVLFNRQPSLHKMSMMGHRIVPVIGKSLKLNPSVTSPYNADFDGDEMNIFVPQNHLSMLELRNIARVEKQIISPQSNKPIIGSIMDNVVGSYIMNNDDEYLTYGKTMNLLLKTPGFNGTVPRPDTNRNGVDLWSAKRIFSLILPGNNFSYKCKDVVIKNSVIQKGEFNKKIVGSGAGGLVHVINNDIGSEKSYDFLNDIQRLTNKFLANRGFSVGFDDIKRTHNLQKTNRDTIAKTKDEVFKYIEDVYHNATKISKETFESKIFNKLNKARDDIGSNVMKTIDKNNSFYQMIQSGAKGNVLNISQILGSVGQQNVQWKKKNGRSPLIINNRSLPYFNQFDCSPEARGFVQHSFVDGLDSVEFFFHMQAGREGVIDTACKTADVGYLQRKLVKSLENIKVHYDLTVRNEANRIVQYTYGHKNTNTIREEKLNLNLLDKNVKQFDKAYKWTAKEIKDTYTCKIKKDVIIKEYEYLVGIRTQLYERKINEDDFVCDTINIPRMIKKVKAESDDRLGVFGSDGKLKPVHPVYILKQLKKLQDLIRVSNTKSKPIEDMNDYNLLITRALIRSELSTKQVVLKHKLNKKQFDTIIKTIKSKFYRDLIAPGTAVGTLSAQSIGEPCTQLSVAYDTKVKVRVDDQYSEPKIGKLIDTYMEKHPEHTYKTHITEDGKASYVMPVPKEWNIKVPGINYKTQKVEYKRVTEFSKHPPNGRLVRIKTKSGKTVIATLAHSFVTKKKGKVMTIRGDQLRVGDVVPIYKGK